MFSPIFINISVTILLSISIIICLHYLWDYLKDTYSTKKTKDLVNTQTEKYKQLATGINNTNSQSNPFMSEEEKQSMNDELTNLVKSFD